MTKTPAAQKAAKRPTGLTCDHLSAVSLSVPIHEMVHTEHVKKY